MPFFALLVIFFLVGVAGYVLVEVARQRRTPDELKGDWWSEFERDFRAYARARRRGERT